MRALTESGTVVAVGSQAPSGALELERYAGGRLAQECGAVGIGDMTIEAAIVKLMYLAGTLDSPGEIAAALLEPIAGEVTPATTAG